MPDKKLTDNEIKKALECCGNIVDSTCKECVYHETYNVSCIVHLVRDALNLINRLQAENERLQNCIDEQDIEISRLYKRIDETKAEAYKKCIEKVKENFTEQFCGQKYDLIHSWFNNALKELVGDAE